MNKTISIVALALAASWAMAQDEAESAEGEAVQAKAAKKNVATFTALPFCRKATSPAEVCLPGQQTWAPIEEGRFYPLGCSYRTQGNGSLTMAFGPGSSASISGDAAFGTRQQAYGAKDRTVVGVEGELLLDLDETLAPGMFTVAFQGCTVSNLVGSSKLVREAKGDGDQVTVRCVTGSLSIGGRHFEIPAMQAANEIKIRTSHDCLETILYGTSGDYVVRLDEGIKTKDVVADDGSVQKVTNRSTLDWRLSPKTKVQINRAVPAIGERLSVSMMTFDAAGELKNNFAYAESRAEVNSGELVKATAAEKEELAKRAAEATTEAAGDAESDEEKDEGDKASDNENKNNESSDKE